MQSGKLLLATTLLTLSGAAYAQTATELQQQQTEASVADQAARTQAATQGQQLKTMAASEEQARKTQAAVQDQANTTAKRVQQNQSSSTGTTVISGPAGTIIQSGPVSTYYPHATTPQPIGGDEISKAQQNLGNDSANPAEKQLQNLFNEIDTDHSGLLSKTEFSLYFKTVAGDPRFQGYDTNKDMNISYFEFRAPNVSGKAVQIPNN